MTKNQISRTVTLFLLLLAGTLVFAPRLWSDPTAAAAELDAIWARVANSGAYDFRADVTQTATPLATVRNAGRARHETNFHMEGGANLADESMHLILWTNGGSVMDPASGVEIRVQEGSAVARQGGGDWEEIDGFTGIFAPGGDLMAYAQAAENVSNLGTAVRNTPVGAIEVTRYTFDISGQDFAVQLHEQMREQAVREGLPASVGLGLPHLYAEMTGTGELWVAADGLPLRQTFSLEFPPDPDDYVATAEVTVDFSGFAPAATTGGTGLLASPIGRIAGMEGPARNGPGLLAVVMGIWLATQVLVRRRSKPIYAAVVIAVSLSMLVTPLLTTQQVAAYSDRQMERQAAYEEKAASAEAQETIREQTRAVALDPHADPLAATHMTATAAPVAQDNTGGRYYDPSCENDPNGDPDGDGLTNLSECLLGTLPDVADTDTDGVTDGEEVMGFSYNGQSWYANPLDPDTNKDGLGDAKEWHLDADGNGIPDDTDGDGTPDLWDDDNDGDGVRDSLDLSPYATTKAQDAFTGANPFALTFDNLVESELVRVEFQIRPTEAGHLWYSQSVLDWPQGDQQAQIQDVDGKSFYDVDPTLPPWPNANGDVRVIPMLEIEITGGETNLPSQEILNQFGISVLQTTTDTQTAYVPLQLVSDDVGDANVAFYARMFYQAGAEWGQAHQVRLVWVVQALNDICSAYDNGICSAYSDYNQLQVIQTYDESWYFTGLHVMEEHSADIALIYEDPQETPNIEPGLDDAPLYVDTLYGLLYGLDYSFLAGRDCDTTDADGNCVGDGQLDVTVDTIGDRFNHATNSYDVNDPAYWGLPNVLNVVKNGVQRTPGDGYGSYGDIPAYDSIDLAMLNTTITQTVGVLDTHFTPVWSASEPITPTIMLAYQQTYRDLNLDQQINNDPNLAWSGGSLTLDLPQSGANAVEVDTMNSAQWTPYAYDPATGWAPADIQAYWDTMNSKLVPSFDDINDPDEAQTYQTMTQSVYVSAYSGFNNIVKSGDMMIVPTYQQPDAPFFLYVTKNVGKIAKQAIKYYYTYSDTLERIAVRIQLTADRTGTSDLSAAGAYFKMQVLEWWNADTEWTDVVSGVAFLVAGAVALFGLFVEYGLSNASDGLSLAGKITAAAGVGSLMLYFSVLKPMYKVYKLANALLGPDTFWAEAIATTLTKSSSVIGAVKQSGVFGMLLGIGLAIGMFVYVWASGLVSPGTIAFNEALALTLSAAITAVILFVLSVSVIGTILVGILTLVDTVFMLAGSKFSITGTVVKAIAGVLYQYDLDTTQDIASSLDVTLGRPEDGIIAGNAISQTLVMTTTLIQTRSESIDRLRSNSLVYGLSLVAKNLSTSVGARSAEWIVSVHSFNALSALYQAVVVDQPTVQNTLSAGVNTGVPFYLDSAYALRGESCWVGFCSDKTISGNSSDDLGDLVTLDVLPATLSEFLQVRTWGTVTFLDGDGDGMLPTSAGGLDPDDSTWDIDGDRLSDAYEVTLRSLPPAEGGIYLDPENSDSDLDGLTDYAELRNNTNPDNSDTDGDGLADLEEALLLVDGNGAVVRNDGGGWLIPYAYDAATQTTNTFRVYSDPLQSDADVDGLSDLFEQSQTTLNADPWADPTNPHVFNPNVWTESPVALYLDDDTTDGFVMPGASVVYTTTTANNLSSGQELVGQLSLDLPGGVSGAPLSQVVDINSGESSSLVSTLTFDSSQTASYELSSTMELTDFDQTRWVWDEVAESSRSALTGVPRAIAVAFVDGWEASYVMVTREQSQTEESINAYTVQLDGTVVDAITLASASLTSGINYTDPDIVCNEQAACLVVWGEQSPGSYKLPTARLANGLHNPSFGQLLTSSTNYGRPLLAPAVATDGTDFMVAWGQQGDELWDAIISVILVPDTGTPGFAAFVAQTTFDQSNVNIEWTGDSYLTIWTDLADLHRAAVNSNGDVSNRSVVGPGGGWLQSNGGVHAPTLTHDAISNQTLLVYRSVSGAMEARILTADESGAPFPLVENGADGENVSVAVSADSKNSGWILAWTAAETVEYRALSPGGSLRGDIAQADQSALTSVALSCVRPKPLLELALDEDAGATVFKDSSPNDFLVTCGDSGNYQCPEAGVSSERGNAAAFSNDRDTDMRVPSGIDLANRSFTLSAWAKHTVPDKSGMIIGQGTRGTNQLLAFGFPFAGGNFGCSFGDNRSFTAETYLDTQWHHFVCTYDTSSGERAIYVDGVRAETKEDGEYTGNYIGNGPLVIGRGADNCCFYDGLIQDVLIYDRALSAVEVGDIYERPLAVYDLDEASGSQRFINSAETGFNGQCSGSECPTMGVPGVSYTAAHFDGVDDVIVIPPGKESDTTYQWTFEDNDTTGWSYTDQSTVTISTATRSSAATKYVEPKYASIFLGLTNLPPHDQLDIAYDLYVIEPGWVGSGLYEALPDATIFSRFIFSVESATVMETTFSNKPDGVGEYQLYPSDSNQWGSSELSLYAANDCSESQEFAHINVQGGDTFAQSDSTGLLVGPTNCVKLKEGTAAFLYDQKDFRGTRYTAVPGSELPTPRERINSIVVGPGAYAPKHGSTGETLVANGNENNSVYSIQSTVDHSQDSFEFVFQGDGIFGLDNMSVDVIKDSNSLALRDSSFTLSAWVKRDESNREEWIITQGTDEQNNGLFFGFIANNRFRCAFYGDNLDSPNTHTDSEWRHWACTYDAATRKRTLYFDGVPVAQDTPAAPYTGRGATYLGGRLNDNSGYFAGSIDEVGVWPQALNADEVQELYEKVKVENESVLVCQLPVSDENGELQTNSLKLSETTTRIGDISQTVTRTLTVDNDKPTIDIQTLKDGQYVSGADRVSIGGSAADPTSYVAGVQVRSDGNASSWVDVEGKSAWSYAWDPDGQNEGEHTVQVQAVDAVGNESAVQSVNFVLDRMAPTVSTTATKLRPKHDTTGRWYVPLSGSVSDPNAGSKPGSGATAVDVLLQGQKEASGNGWQPATLSGANWTIDYMLPQAGNSGQNVVDHSGAYTVTLRATDAVSNTTLTIADPTTQLRLDATGPTVGLTEPISTTELITNALTLRGTVDDEDEIGAVEVNWTPSEQVDALSGSVLYLPFDDGNATEYLDDQSGAGNAAFCEGAGCPEMAAPGQRDNAVRFDGAAEWMEIAQDDGFNFGPGDDFTIAFWVKIGPDAQQDQFGSIIDKWSGALNEGYPFAVRYNRENGRILGQRYDGTSNPTVSSAQAVNDGGFHHVAFVKRGDSLFLYIDGEQSGDEVADGATGNTTNTTNIFLGARGNGFNHFAGTLDELLIYDRALAAYEIENLTAYGQSTWTQATLDGNLWSYTVPADENGIEGFYQLNVRATDALGNVTPLSGQRLWRGEIDTKPPAISFAANVDNSGGVATTAYTCNATDFNLGNRSSCMVSDGDTPTFRPSDRTLTPYYQVDAWYAANITDTSRLYGIDALRIYTGTEVSGVTLEACDIYGRCASAETALEVGQPLANSARMLDPATGEVLTSLDMIELQGHAYAEDGLDLLFVKVNGATTYFKSWREQETSATWSFDWLPSGEGVYHFTPVLAESEDEVPLVAADEQSGIADDTATPRLDEIAELPFALYLPLIAHEWYYAFLPIVQTPPSGTDIFTGTTTTIYVDLAPPVVALDKTAWNQADALGARIVELTGVVSDSLAVHSVEVQIDGGAWQRAGVDTDGHWRWPWRFDIAPDGERFQVAVRATDLAGRTTEISEEVTVDIVAPIPGQVSYSYINSVGAELPMDPGDRLADAVTLVVSWDAITAGDDDYAVGFSTDYAVSPEELTVYDEPGSHSQAVGISLQWYATVAYVDEVGNTSRVETGPFYVNQ